MVSVIIISDAIVLFLFQFKSKIKESYTYAGRAAAPVKTKLLPVPKQWSDACSDHMHAQTCMIFFAVAVENFFERSEQFKVEIPELYSVLTKLLNQDPY